MISPKSINSVNYYRIVMRSAPGTVEIVNLLRDKSGHTNNKLSNILIKRDALYLSSMGKIAFPSILT